MGQDVAANQALDMLTLQGSFDGRGLDDDIVRKDETDELFVASDVGR
jgi:hypothetical protein